MVTLPALKLKAVANVSSIKFDWNSKNYFSFIYLWISDFISLVYFNFDANTTVFIAFHSILYVWKQEVDTCTLERLILVCVCAVSLQKSWAIKSVLTKLNPLTQVCISSGICCCVSSSLLFFHFFLFNSKNNGLCKLVSTTG